MKLSKQLFKPKNFKIKSNLKKTFSIKNARCFSSLKKNDNIFKIKEKEFSKFNFRYQSTTQGKENAMFCFQCEQTEHSTGCTTSKYEKKN